MVTKPLDEHHPFMEKALTHPLTSRWGSYEFAILSCLGLESLLLGLGWTDLGVPYLYHYDFLYNSALIKGIVDHGWYLNNPSLGAPGGLAMHDYPEVANFNYLLVKLPEKIFVNVLVLCI